MKNFSILLLKDSNFGVSQYHFGAKFMFFLLTLILVGVGALGWKFFDQHQTILKQAQLLD